MNCKKIALGVLLLSSAGIASAQEAISASGGDASGSGGSASYTVGQVAYTYSTDGTSSVLAGVQQPYEISSPVGLDESGEIGLSLMSYPNPTIDNLTLTVEDYAGEKLTYRLVDIQGKLLATGQISDASTLVSMESLPAANYFLTVNDPEKTIKTFTIIKN